MAKADSIGKGLGGFFSSPFGLGILALGALFIFRDKISEFFQSGFDTIGSSLAPNININVETPSFDFGNLFNGHDPTDHEHELVPDTGLLGQEEILVCECGTSIVQDVQGNVQQQCIPCAEKTIITGGIPDSDPPIVIGDFNPFDTIGDETGIVVAPKDEFGLGGGPTFVSGVTTFGDNLVDTLSEVLSIFPDLSASQARDTLEEFPGLTGSQFRLIDPDVINITGG